MRDLDTERAVLAAMLINPVSIPEIQGILTEKDFYEPRHQLLFKCFTHLGEKLDLVSANNILDRWYKGKITPSYLTDVADSAAHSANVCHHAETVRELSLKRNLDSIGKHMSQRSNNGTPVSEIISETSRRLESLSAENTKEEWRGPETEMALQEFEDAKKGEYIGYEPYLKSLAEFVTFEPTWLNLICGRPGEGKTTLAMNLALAWAEKGIPCAFFSIEMSRQVMRQKLACMVAQVDSQKARKGTLEPLEHRRLQTKLKENDKLPILLHYDKELTLPRMRAEALQLAKKHPIKIWFLDYIQIMTEGKRDGRQRHEMVGEFSWGFKKLMEEVNGVGIACVQLRRREKNDWPTLTQLKEAGKLEEDADTVIAIWRYKGYLGDRTKDAKLFVLKDRHGPSQKMMNVEFDGEMGWFIDG